MYGMPGNRFSDKVCVSQVSEVADLVKEAQVGGKASRTFFTASRRELEVSYDGMFLVDASSGEILNEDLLVQHLESNTFFTMVC